MTLNLNGIINVRNVLIISLLLISKILCAKVYFISPTGSDLNGKGSKFYPWRSLNKACSSVNAEGDTIYVTSGTYIENSTCKLNVGVSIIGSDSTSLITSLNPSDNFLLLDLSSNSSGTYGNQSISNIKLDGKSICWWCIRVNNRSNIRIHHCIIRNFAHRGITFQGTPADEPQLYEKGNQFYNNILTNCGLWTGGKYPSGYALGCLMIGAQSEMGIYNNTIIQNGFAEGLNGEPICFMNNGYNKAIKIYNNVIKKAPQPSVGGNTIFAIELWNSRGSIEIFKNNIEGSIDCAGTSSLRRNYPKAFDIHDNVFSWPTLMPLVNDGEKGIQIEYSAEYVYIYRNHFINLCRPIYATCPAGAFQNNIYIFNNVIENVGSNTTQSYKGWGILIESTDKTDNYHNWYIYNNDIISKKTGGSQGSTMWGINIPNGKGLTKNMNIYNNIIFGFSHAAIVLNVSDSVNISHNLFYQNGNLNKVMGDTPNHLKLTNNLVADPKFTSTSDFHLQKGSPAIGSGMAVKGNENDYEEYPFLSPPSIGAYEYREK